MRSTILKLANTINLDCKEITNLTEEHILNAEEIFLTNAIQGIRWVLGFKEKRYFNFLSRKLTSLLNKEAFVKY